MNKPEYSYTEYSFIYLAKKFADREQQAETCEVAYTNYLNYLLLPLLSNALTNDLDEEERRGSFCLGIFMPLMLKRDAVKLLQLCCEYWTLVFSTYRAETVSLGYHNDRFMQASREQLLEDLQKIIRICKFDLQTPEQHHFYFDYNLLDDHFAITALQVSS